MKKSAILLTLMMTASMTACGANAIPESPTGADDYRQAAIGTWQIDGDTSASDEYPDALVITGAKKAYYRSTTEITKSFYFDENRNFIFITKYETLTKKNYDFLAGVFSFDYQDQNILRMKKTDNSDDVFGEYLLLSGEFKKKAASAISENSEHGFRPTKDKLTVTTSENQTLLSYYDRIDGFKMKENTMITSFDGGSTLYELAYTADSDTLSFTNSEGAELVFKRLG